jgi:hypothetical protein
MIKKWNEFIREFVENSDSLIDIKMTEIKELIDSVGGGHNLLYEWQNKNDHEIIINFNWDNLSIRYEFSIDNMSITKIVSEQIDFQEDVDSIDEALDIIEKDIHNIIGISESYKGQWDSSIKERQVLSIIEKIKKISDLSIPDSADIEGLIESLEKSLSSYDDYVIENVVDLMLFNYPDVDENYIISKIIEIGDYILEKYGTEPIMVLYAFEDAFSELSNHYYISEERGRPKARKADSDLWKKTK